MRVSGFHIWLACLGVIFTVILSILVCLISSSKENKKNKIYEFNSELAFILERKDIRNEELLKRFDFVCRDKKPEFFDIYKDELSDYFSIQSESPEALKKQEIPDPFIPYYLITLGAPLDTRRIPPFQYHKNAAYFVPILYLAFDEKIYIYRYGDKENEFGITFTPFLMKSQ